MSYMDEIRAIARPFTGNTIILDDPMNGVGPLSSDKCIWTLVSEGIYSYKRNIQTCCFDTKSSSKCTIDGRASLGTTVLGIIRDQDPQYTWSQYDLSIFAKGKIFDPYNVIGGIVITRPVVIKQTTGSIARIIVPGQAQTLLNIEVNGTIHGTIYYGSGSTTGIITITTTIAVNDGDVISIVSTDMFDEEGEDYTITLSGLAQNVELWDTVI